MKHPVHRGTAIAGTLAIATCFAIGLAVTSTASDTQSLERGAIADFTPKQKYRSAIREAGGAYKAAKRECADAVGVDRMPCMRDAKTVYERDMAEAKQLLIRKD